MQLYIRHPERRFYFDYDTDIQNAIFTICVEKMTSLIEYKNLTDLKKVWGIITPQQRLDFFAQYIECFDGYKLNIVTTHNDDKDNIKINKWVNRFVNRMFLYFDEQQLFTSMNALAYDTEINRYTDRKDHVWNDGTIDKNIIDERNYDYPQLTGTVIPGLIPNITGGALVVDNEVNTNSVVTSLNIYDDKAVTSRDTTDNMTQNSHSGEESWSIPWAVIEKASMRFEQMKNIPPFDSEKYWEIMIVYFNTAFQQSEWYQ